VQPDGEASVADEPEAVFAVTIKKKFLLALMAYAALGVLAWTTLSDEPIHLLNANIRLRTDAAEFWDCLRFGRRLYYWRTRIEEEQARAKPTE